MITNKALVARLLIESHGDCAGIHVLCKYCPVNYSCDDVAGCAIKVDAAKAYLQEIYDHPESYIEELL